MAKRRRERRGSFSDVKYGASALSTGKAVERDSASRHLQAADCRSFGVRRSPILDSTSGTSTCTTPSRGSKSPPNGRGASGAGPAIDHGDGAGGCLFDGGERLDLR